MFLTDFFRNIKLMKFNLYENLIIPKFNIPTKY